VYCGAAKTANFSMLALLRKAEQLRGEQQR
jgi:hypothetical protein